MAENLEKQSFNVTVVERPYGPWDGSRIEGVRVAIETAAGEREVSLRCYDEDVGSIELADGILTLSGSPLTYVTRVLEAAQLDVDLRDHEDDLIRGATRIGKWWVSMCGNKRRCYLPWSPEHMGLEIKRLKDGRFKSAKYNGKKIDERRAELLEREIGTKAYLTLLSVPELRTDKMRIIMEHKGQYSSGQVAEDSRANVEAMVRAAA